MNFRKNDGVAGTDIAISMIIIIIFIPTIFGITYNIQKTNKDINRKANAVNIATDIMEIAKSKSFANIDTTDASGLMTDLNLSTKYQISARKAEIMEELAPPQYSYKYFSTTIDGVNYLIQVELRKYNSSDILKVLKVQVYYPIGKEVESIDISRVFQKE